MKRITLLLIIAIIAASSSKLAAQQHSISVKNPLLVIDSVVLGASGINLPLLSPDDIKSINVYKNKEAAALWGKAGENGVIVITSKDPSKYEFRSLNDIALSHNIILKGAAIFTVNDVIVNDTAGVKLNNKDIETVSINAKGFPYLEEPFKNLQVVAIKTKSKLPSVPKDGEKRIRGKDS